MKLSANKLILIMFIIVAGLCIFSLFYGCVPTRQKCLEMYPQQYKDSIITKRDTIVEPLIIQLPGDTIKIDAPIERPCKDSLIQWQRFNRELNLILNNNWKLKQTIIFTRDSLKYTAKTKEDTIKILNKVILIQNDKIRTYQQAVIAYQNKVPAWCWWLIGGLTLIGCILGFLLKR